MFVVKYTLIVHFKTKYRNTNQLYRIRQQYDLYVLIYNFVYQRNTRVSRRPWNCMDIHFVLSSSRRLSESLDLNNTLLSINTVYFYACLAVCFFNLFCYKYAIWLSVNKKNTIKIKCLSKYEDISNTHITIWDTIVVIVYKWHMKEQFRPVISI